MKLIQLNVWMGEYISQLLSFIEEEQPDILCAQEVLTKPTGPSVSVRHDTHSRLSEYFSFDFFAPTVAFDFEGARVTTGNAIYSRWPMASKQTIFTMGDGVHIESEDKAFDYNVRNIQRCEIKPASKQPLTIANHHGYHEPFPEGSEKSIESMHRAADALTDISGPMIFSGDLNVKPLSPAMKALDKLNLNNLAVKHGAKTTLSSASHVSIPVVCDYILASDEVQVKDFTISDRLVSDHKALILEFDL